MARMAGLSIPLNSRKCVAGSGPSSMPFQPRVRYIPERRKGRKTILPRIVVRCGCCKAGPLEIFFDKYGIRNPRWGTLEINGVDGHIRDWRAILLPLLGFSSRRGVWADRLLAGRVERAAGKTGRAGGR